MDAVVFSSFVPNRRALEVASEYVNVLQKRFSDCDIYMGVNPGSMPEWFDLLQNSNLNIIIGEVEPSLVIDSDVSPYQKALNLLKETNKEYDLIWFGHTKGTTANRPELREYLIHNYFYKRKAITKLFNEYPRMGSYARDATVAPKSMLIFDKKMNKLYNFKYPPITMYYIFTFYVIRGNIVKDFIENCNKSLLTKNIVKALGYDRWFFEREFPKITERLGYYPFFTELYQHLAEIPVIPENLDILYAIWEQNLPEEIRTGYKPSDFMQLFPAVRRNYCGF